MPHNNPELWPILWAAGVAMATALFRNLYYGGHTFKTYCFESMVVGFMTLGVGFGLKAAGAGGDWVFFVGSIFGLFGVDYIRKKADTLISKRVDTL